MTDKKTTTPDSELLSVTVIVDNHTHAGEPVKKGTQIKVDAETKAFMIKHNIIKG